LYQNLQHCVHADKEFRAVINHVYSFIQHHDLYELSLPHLRRPPQHHCGTGGSYTATTAEEHYRAVYFNLIDSVTTQLNERFNKTSNGLRTYQKLESMLLSDVIDDTVCGQYQELIKDDLLHQLAMFRRQYMTFSNFQLHKKFCSRCAVKLDWFFLKLSS
jgi:hypothetical protein